ncbi:MAG: elongation factor P [Candidatus Paceibacterota bacterium]|jgi:elongation factor P
MSLLEYNEVVERKYIILDGQPYEVLTSHVFRKQQRKPVNAAKLKNLITGKVTEHSFHVSEKTEEAEIETREVKYLYTSKGEYWFCEAEDPAKRFQLSAEIVGTAIQFIRTNTVMDSYVFDDKIMGVRLPIKADLKVVDAPPAVKGDTAKGGNKQLKLETGAVINGPLFIEEGETIRVNTETGEYVERVNEGKKF